MDERDRNLDDAMSIEAHSARSPPHSKLQKSFATRWDQRASKAIKAQEMNHVSDACVKPRSLTALRCATDIFTQLWTCSPYVLSVRTLKEALLCQILREWRLLSRENG